MEKLFNVSTLSFKTSDKKEYIMLKLEHGLWIRIRMKFGWIKLSIDCFA